MNDKTLDEIARDYNATRDEWGNWKLVDSDDAIRILNDSMRDAAQTLIFYADYAKVGSNVMHLDDSEDYTNAASDEINWLLSTLHSGDKRFILDAANWILRAHRDDLENGDKKIPMRIDDQRSTDWLVNPNANASGFMIGYADHDTPLSSLMHFNEQDECPRCN